MEHIGVYSVYDAKARTYITPFFSTNRDTAMRIFAHAANDPGTDIGRFPSDYTLFCLGFWYAETGSLVEYEAKEPLGCAIEFVREDQS